MRVGRVAELWRHPVKSMQGDRQSRVPVREHYGIPGDRGWALRDEQANEIRGAKKITSLLRFHARYLEEPEGASTPPVEITLPGGTRITSADPGVHKALSDVAGREVTLWPRQPIEQHARNRRVGSSSEADLRAMLDLEPEDPIPDFSTLIALARHALPGTYFDAQPLSLLTSSSMTALADLVPESVIDTRRFRQNIIVDSMPDLSGFCEFDWIGHQLRIGSVLVEVTAPISRCLMVVLPQDDLPHDRPILRSLVHETGMDFGIYLTIIEPGEIAEGDPINLY